MISYLRATFVLQSVTALHKALAAEATTAHPRWAHSHAPRAISSQCQISAVYSHGPELCAEEQNIERSVMATSRLRLFPGWTLTHTDDLPAAFQRGKKMPDRYKPFLAAVSSGKGPARHRPALPEPYWTNRDAPDVLRRAIVQKAPAVGAWGLPEGAEALLGKAATAEAPDVVDDHGRDRQASEQRGGEDEALAAMRAFIWEEERLCRYVGSSDSMTPGVDNALNATTRLSAYLAHGCLSARRLYDEVRQYERRRVRNRSTYWVYHELIMRSFSCRSWGARLFSRDGPLDASGHRWRDPGSSETRRLFLRWTRGATGYPFVDAGMRQLAHDRMDAAPSPPTRGVHRARPAHSMALGASGLSSGSSTTLRTPTMAIGLPDLACAAAPREWTGDRAPSRLEILPRRWYTILTLSIFSVGYRS